MMTGQGMTTINILSRTAALDRITHKTNMLTTEDMRAEIERLEAISTNEKAWRGWAELRIAELRGANERLEQDLVDLRYVVRGLQERLKLTEAARDLAQGDLTALRASLTHEAPTYHVEYPGAAVQDVVWNN